MNLWTTGLLIELIDQDKKIKRQEAKINEQQRTLEELERKQQNFYDSNNDKNENPQTSLNYQDLVDNTKGLKTNIEKVWCFIVDNNEKDLIPSLIAETLDIARVSVNGIVASFQKKGLIYREEKNGLSLIKLTKKGRKFNRRKRKF